MTDQSEDGLIAKAEDQLEDSQVTVSSEEDALLCCHVCQRSTCGREGDAMELLSPCLCQTWIHRRCFDEWSL
ncbi:hypothetical protein Ae201684P_008490 [Aphanomyces euteiches]|nr:hypothetical protein Ae201684P_008490 [Aphanomyces euteiches]